MGRGHQVNQNGEKNSMAKLKETDVIEIIHKLKNPHYKIVQLANEYNVLPKTIRNIKNEVTWKHIDRNI